MSGMVAKTMQDFFRSVSDAYRSRHPSKQGTNVHLDSPEQVEPMARRAKELGDLLDNGNINGRPMTLDEIKLATIGRIAYMTEFDGQKPIKSGK